MEWKTNRRIVFRRDLQRKGTCNGCKRKCEVMFVSKRLKGEVNDFAYLCKECVGKLQESIKKAAYGG